ncbi:hypothetical protein HY480_04410 [Candidatus Uhrbacteria bacterium]|nr:hypothetical protein [Candidatus Uhrbacteria bacterium]
MRSEGEPFDDLGMETEAEEAGEERVAADSALSVSEFTRAHQAAIARERERFARMDATALAEEIAKARATLEELGARREDEVARGEALAATVMALEARGADPEVADLLAETSAECIRAYELLTQLHETARRVVLHLRELHLLYGKHDVPQA